MLDIMEDLSLDALPPASVVVLKHITDEVVSVQEIVDTHRKSSVCMRMVIGSPRVRCANLLAVHACSQALV
jgi:hypothetical protein